MNRKTIIFILSFTFFLFIINYNNADASVLNDSDPFFSNSTFLNEKSEDHDIRFLQKNMAQDKESVDISNKVNSVQKSLRNNSKNISTLDDHSYIEVPTESTTVSDWSSFKKAAESSSIGTITLTTNLIAETSSSQRVNMTTNKAIKFNGFSINMRGSYLTISSDASINFQNSNLIQSNSNYMIRAETSGEVIFSGATQLNGPFFSGERQYNSSLKFIDATAVAESDRSDPSISFQQNSSNCNLSIENSSLVDKTRVFMDITNIGKTLNIINSQVNSISSNNSNEFFITHYSNRDPSSDRRKEGSVLNISANSRITTNKRNGSSYCGPIRLIGENSEINLKDGSKLDSTNQLGSAVVISGEGSSFNVDGEGTELNATRGDSSIRSGDNAYAPVRFAYSGSMTFNISNKAKVNINQNANNSGYCIRMFGGDNAVRVGSGAEFNCINNTTSGNPGNGSSEGIYYTGGSGTNAFYLTGKDSQVLLSSRRGRAITSTLDLNISAGDGTSFVSRGYYPNNSIFRSSGKIDFQMGVPRYFDFMNTAVDGNTRGNLFNNNSRSTFTHKEIPLSVWLNTKNVNLSPTASWNHVSATYSDSDFTKYTTETPGNGFQDFLTANRGLSNLGRMTANTAPAQVKNAPLTPNDADSYVWIPSLMPAENNAYRPAYDDEVYAEVQLTYPDGTVKTAIGSSKQSLNYYEYSSGQKIDGAIKIPVSSFDSNKKYLEAGTKVKILKVWRNDPDPDNPSAIVSKADDNKYSEQTVIRGTVPDPAKIKNDLTKISQWSTELEGTGEPGAKLSWQVLHQDGSVTNHDDAATVDSNGNWKINNISGIVNKDRIRIILKISIDGQDLSNPIDKTVFHDKTFDPATVIDVGGTDTITLNVPKELDFGIIPAYYIGTRKAVSKEYNVQVNDDRSPAHGNWVLSAKASNFKRQGSNETVSNNNLSLGIVNSSGNKYQNISGNDYINSRTQQPTDPYRGTTSLDYLHGPQQLRLKANGVSNAGKYTSVLSWTATDSL